MRAVIQRVTEASVVVGHEVVGSIGEGLMILLGIEDEDNETDIEWLSNKIINLRIFNDEQGIMNCSMLDNSGDILLISQFTLYASTKKGNRPSYIRAGKPPVVVPLYEMMILRLEKYLGKKIQTGVFGADMKVQLINDGPVTIFIDSKNRK